MTGKILGKGYCLEKKVLAFCDPEEEFAYQLSAYLKNQEHFPWVLQSFTDTKEFGEYLLLHPEAHCMLSESVADEIPEQVRDKDIILLNESGYLSKPEWTNINKYQPADRILRQLLQVYAEKEEKGLPRIEKNTKTVMAGFFSPVGRAMQTSFALCFGQYLAKNYRTLYISLEYYCGQKEMGGEENGRDIMTLLYYLKSEKEKFATRLQTVCGRMGNLNYIEPAFVGPNLVYITEDDWLELLHEIALTGLFDYVVLDLCEGLQGLFSLLQECEVVYNMVRPDYAAIQKQSRYEHILMLNDRKDILQRMRKISLPSLYHLPEKVEEWSKSELYGFAVEQAKSFLENMQEKQAGKEE